MEQHQHLLLGKLPLGAVKTSLLINELAGGAILKEPTILHHSNQSTNLYPNVNIDVKKIVNYPMTSVVVVVVVDFGSWVL